ncbi:MAG: hypothetical protein PHG23_02740 [Candidatus Pacebacteria bacterium]|nr:hypothetical protein [Candidatus Paceibacterota bacterium]
MNKKTGKNWHSSEPDSKVYHDNKDCNTGNNIERENLEKGTGGHRKCKECEHLDHKHKH